MKALVYKVKCAIKKISLEDDPRRKTLEKDKETVQTDYVVKEDVPDVKMAKEAQQVMQKVLPYGLDDILDDDYEILEKVPQEQVQQKAREIIKDDISNTNKSSARQSTNGGKKRPAKHSAGIISKTTKKVKNAEKR